MKEKKDKRQMEVFFAEEMKKPLSCLISLGTSFYNSSLRSYLSLFSDISSYITRLPALFCRLSVL